MSNYWAPPDINQFNFNPSTPPVQEALGALQAKTQYWLQGASQIKGQYDEILGKELSHQTSIDKVDAFRKDFDSKLKDIAKKDLGIGENRANAMKAFDPITRDRGILVDEKTTENFNNILAQAKSDANKNGGKYYNQDSVEYASQMLQRYKSQGDNGNTEYYSILQANSYMPYNEKAQKELADFIKNTSKEKVEHPMVDPNNPLRLIIQEGPAYSKADIASLARETLSPAALQMYELQGKVEFNRFQLAARTPEELHQIGSEYKAQIDGMYNEKIDNTKVRLSNLNSATALLSKNDPEYDNKITFYQDAIQSSTQELKEYEKRKNDIKAEYFTDPANWKLGEAYASELHMEQKIRNVATSLSNRDYSIKWKANEAEIEGQKLALYREKIQMAREVADRKASEKANGNGVDPSLVSDQSITIGGDEIDPIKNGEAIMAELKTIDVTAYNGLKTPLLASLGITINDEGELQTLDVATPNGNMLITDSDLGMSTTGLNNLQKILSSTTTNLKKGSDGKVDMSNLTVQQVKTNLDAILSSKDKMKEVIDYTAFENNSIPELTKYYYKLSTEDGRKNNITKNASKIYKSVLDRYGIKSDNVKDDIFNFDSDANMEKLIPFGDIEKFATGPLTQSDKNKISRYFATGSLEHLNNIKVFAKVVTRRSETGMEYQSTVFTIPDQIIGIRNNFQKAINEIKIELANSKELTYNTKGRTFNVKTELKDSDDRNKQMLAVDVIDLVNQGIGSDKGINTTRTVQAFDFIKNTSGISDDITNIHFTTGTAEGTKGYIELDMNTASLKKKLDDKAVSDDAGVIKNIIQNKGKIKVYLPDSVIDQYAQSPDRSRDQLFKGPIKIDVPSGASFTMRNTAINQPGIVDATLDGEIKAVVGGVTPGTIVIKNISFNERNYVDLANVLSASEDQFRQYLRSTGSIDDIGMKLTEQDAIAFALTKHFQGKAKKDSKGNLVLNIKDLSDEELKTYTNIVKNRKLN